MKTAVDTAAFDSTSVVLIVHTAFDSTSVELSALAAFDSTSVELSAHAQAADIGRKEKLRRGTQFGLYRSGINY